MDFLENPARATQVSQDANAGPEQSDDAPGNAEPSPSRKRSDTRTPLDAQWHESKWQRDRSRTDL